MGAVPAQCGTTFNPSQAQHLGGFSILPLPPALPPAQPSPQQLHTALHLQLKMFRITLYNILYNVVLYLCPKGASAAPRTLRVMGLPGIPGRARRWRHFRVEKTEFSFYSHCTVSLSPLVTAEIVPISSSPRAVPTQAAASPSAPQSQIFSPFL